MELLSTICSNRSFPTRKFLFKTYDNYKVETVYVNHLNKHIICFSSQVGCPVQCKFCNSCNFIRNLTKDEMVEQCEYVQNSIQNIEYKETLFSCMGVGEPSLNWESLRKTFFILNKKYSLSKFAFASVGTNISGIKMLSETDLDIKFQLSIHAINSKQRKLLFGFNIPLYNFLKTRYFFNKVEQSYMLIKGINDSNRDAEILAKTCKKYPIKINKFNPTNSNIFKTSSDRTIKKFITILKSKNCQVEYYETDGSDINAACGQLIGGGIV